MKNKNIYQITSYYPPHLGGLENCVREIAEQLSNKDYKVSVLTSSISFNRDSPVKPNKNLTVHYHKSFDIAHTPLSLDYIKELLKIPKESILHIHIANAFFPEAAYLIAKLRNIKFIAHYHIDLDASGIMGFLLPAYKKIFVANIMKDARKVIALTDSQKELIISKYGVHPSKITVIPNGVGRQFFIDDKNSRNDAKKILYVGRISKQKNLSRLIHAMSILKDKYTLDIVGDGDQKEMILQLIQKFNLKNVFLHGTHSNETLIQYYREAAVFVLPSDNEGMSLSLLEAMAAELPIITTDLPQTRDFLSHGAILVDKPNAENFALAIDNLLCNPQQMKRMASSNKKQAKDYSWDTIINKIEHLYNQLT